MFKMPSHPTVFIIVMEQGELGEGRDEKDFCFSLCFSTSLPVFLPSRKAGVELELLGGEGGRGEGRTGPVSGSWNIVLPVRALEVSVHRVLLERGPQPAAEPPDRPDQTRTGLSVPLGVASLTFASIFIKILTELEHAVATYPERVNTVENEGPLGGLRDFFC